MRGSRLSGFSLGPAARGPSRASASVGGEVGRTRVSRQGPGLPPSPRVPGPCGAGASSAPAFPAPERRGAAGMGRGAAGPAAAAAALDPPDPPLQLIARAALAEAPPPAWEREAGAQGGGGGAESPARGAAAPSVKLTTFAERQAPEEGWGALFPRESLRAGRGADAGPASPGPRSALSAALGGASPGRGAVSGATTCMEVHIPGRAAPLALQVGPGTVAAELVAAALRAHEASGEGPRLGRGRPGDFALRLAESGGLPDMSVPALGQRQGLAALGLDAVVLCHAKGGDASERVANSKRRSLATLRSLSRSRVGAGTGRGQGELQSLGEENEAAAPSGRAVLRVRLPCGGGGTIPASKAGREVAVVVSAAWTLGQVREQLETQHGLSLRGLQFCAAEGSAAGIPLEDSAVAADPETLGLLRLLRGAGGGLSNFDVFYSQFNELTASRYTEYAVVKVNRHGTRQARILGVDRDKVYNLPPRAVQPAPRDSGAGAGVGPAAFLEREDRALATGVTKKQFRLIADVQSIDIARGRPAAASVVYREADGSSRAYSLEFESAEVCAELTARIRFLMSLR